MNLLKSLIPVLSTIFIILGIISPAEPVFADTLRSGNSELEQPFKKIDRTKYRGWGYLVSKVKQGNEIPNDYVSSIYAHPHMPKFTPIYFSLNPKESHHSYRHFMAPSRLKIALDFLNKHSSAFRKAENATGVSRFVVAAILLVETHCGRVTGNSNILHRLSRLASVKDPENLKLNFDHLKRKDQKVKFQNVLERANYLENTFYPEIPALLKIAKERGLNVHNIRGSSAGAFGYSQFLPSNYLKFGIDGNNNDIVSLFEEEDAIWSVANYFAGFGWREDLSQKEKKQVVWHYNRSQAYVDTVLDVAGALEQKQG